MRPPWQVEMGERQSGARVAFGPSVFDRNELTLECHGRDFEA
jgi:hypothetical protein